MIVSDPRFGFPNPGLCFPNRAEEERYRGELIAALEDMKRRGVQYAVPPRLTFRTRTGEVRSEGEVVREVDLAEGQRMWKLVEQGLILGVELSGPAAA